MKEHELVAEKLERASLASIFERCPPALYDELGLFHEEIGDALVCGSTRTKSILLNRTIGLGTREPVERERVEAIHAAYEKRGVERYFLHVFPETLVEGEQTFAGTPLVKTRGWMKFMRDASPPLVRETDLRVERVSSPEHGAHFSRITAVAFGFGEALEQVAASLVNDPRWHLFLSWDGDRPAGSGGLFVMDNDALLEWGATDPAFRRRGSQGAVFTARINAARKLGVTRLFTETGEAVEGDPQHSYSNIERYGFVADRVRENWAPPKP